MFFSGITLAWVGVLLFGFLLVNLMMRTPGKGASIALFLLFVYAITVLPVLLINKLNNADVMIKYELAEKAKLSNGIKLSKSSSKRNKNYTLSYFDKNNVYKKRVLPSKNLRLVGDGKNELIKKRPQVFIKVSPKEYKKLVFWYGKDKVKSFLGNHRKASSWIYMSNRRLQKYAKGGFITDWLTHDILKSNYDRVFNDEDEVIYKYELHTSKSLINKYW